MLLLIYGSASWHSMSNSNSFAFRSFGCDAIKQLLTQANGGFIMSASHNPGGPEYDWGIKVSF